jgi:hypothetical protein
MDVAARTSSKEIPGENVSPGIFDCKAMSLQPEADLRVPGAGFSMPL